MALGADRTKVVQSSGGDGQAAAAAMIPASMAASISPMTALRTE
jgi:hypothetical protein